MLIVWTSSEALQPGWIVIKTLLPGPLSLIKYEYPLTLVKPKKNRVSITVKIHKITTGELLTIPGKQY